MAVITETKPETTPNISVVELDRRRDAVRYAASHNRIEGQSLDAESAAIFDAFVRGEIDQAEIRPRLNALHRHR
jgi:hypothetical protein